MKIKHKLNERIKYKISKAKIRTYENKLIFNEKIKEIKNLWLKEKKDNNNNDNNNNQINNEEEKINTNNQSSIDIFKYFWINKTVYN